VDGPLILAVETATRCGSVALTIGGTREGTVLAEASSRAAVTHSRRLLGEIDRMMRESGVGWGDLAAIAVSGGPGSFTGLRIGMAAAKGLAMAAETAFLMIPTLDGLALSCCLSSRRICCLLDARKKEVYCAFYQPDPGSGPPRRVTPLRAVPPQQLLAEIAAEPHVLVGDGATVYRELFARGDNITIVSPGGSMPRAAHIGLLAGDRRQRGEEDDPLVAAPLYVRPSEAELNWK